MWVPEFKGSEKYKDVAVKIVGASSMVEALKTKVHTCSFPAQKLGIYKGQSVREVLKLIA